jgi:hypothetical protein
MLAVASLVVLVGCAGGVGVAGYVEDFVYADIVGVTDSNGLRPDVSSYIEKKYGDNPKKKDAAIIFARSNQLVLEIVASNSPVKQGTMTKLSLATDCLAVNSDVRNFSREFQELTSRTFNTEARIRANLRFSQLADGLSLAIPFGVDPCTAAK